MTTEVEPTPTRLRRWTREAVFLAPHAVKFSLRVVLNFLGNRGVLLAGGVGYNVLLSAVPLFAVITVVLTLVIDEQRLFTVLTIQARQLAPGHADVLLDAVRSLLDSRDVVGWTSFGVLLFFSSFAFRMLEDAIGIIFRQASPPHARSLWVSVVMPYVYVFVLGLAVLALTIALALLSAISGTIVTMPGLDEPLEKPPEFLFDVLGFLGIAALFTSIYKVLPVVEISLRRAAIGGLIAAVLWEIVRAILVYYFTNVSMVNLIYGSFATVIVVLLSLEIGAIILLLGAQVIAELERSGAAGVRWYEDPSVVPQNDRDGDRG